MYNLSTRNNKLLHEAYQKGYRQGLYEQSSGGGLPGAGGIGGDGGNLPPGPGLGARMPSLNVDVAQWGIPSGWNWDAFMNYIGDYLPADMGIQQWWNMVNNAGPSYDWSLYGFTQSGNDWYVMLGNPPGSAGAISISWGTSGWQINIAMP